MIKFDHVWSLIYYVNYIKGPKIGAIIIIGEYFWNLRIDEDDL